MRNSSPKSNPAPMTAALPVMAQPRLPACFITALLVLVTIGLYCPVTGFDLLNYDDPAFVTANPHVQGGLNWEGMKWAFCNTTQAVYWAPLMWLSHMLACQFFGLNPWGHHLVNVLLHATNTALVFLVLRRMTQATWRSMFVAAVFGLHPLRIAALGSAVPFVIQKCGGVVAEVENLSLGARSRNALIGLVQSGDQAMADHFTYIPSLGVLILAAWVDQAIRQYQETIRLKPDFALAHHNIGNVLSRKGRNEEAINQFLESLKLKPDYADARNNPEVMLAEKAHSSPQPGATTNH